MPDDLPPIETPSVQTVRSRRQPALPIEPPPPMSAAATPAPPVTEGDVTGLGDAPTERPTARVPVKLPQALPIEPPRVRTLRSNRPAALPIEAPGFDRPLVVPVPAELAPIELPAARVETLVRGAVDGGGASADDLALPSARGERSAFAPTRASDERRALGPVPGTLRSKPRSRPAYLPGLDGLRAVSVFVVVAYHLEVLRGGFLGVDVFFVISGFLITRLLLAERERDGGVALGGFWLRRFKRLVPAVLVVLVFVMVGSRTWLPAWRLGALRGDALAALGYVANWRFVLSGQSYFSAGAALSPLRHTWSLAIEEQYYLIWPLVVVGVMRLAKARARRVVGVVAGIGALASAAWMAAAAVVGMDLSRIYYGTDTRAFAIFGGAWLASGWDPAADQAVTRAERRKRSKAWALAGLICVVPVGLFFVFGTNSEPAFYQGGFQVMAILTVVLVAGVATDHGAVAHVMGNPVLVWLGRRSYGIYLWSWPVQVFATEYYRLEGARLYGVVVGGAVVLATLSFWLVEEPVRTGRRPVGLPGTWPRPGEPRVPRFVTAAVAVVAVIGTIVAVSAGAPPEPRNLKVTDKQALEAAVGNLTKEEEDALRRSTTTVPIDQGIPGPFGRAQPLLVSRSASKDPSIAFGRPLKVLITGDSVGWSLGWDLRGGVVKSVVPDDRAIIGCGMMPQSSSFVVGNRAPEQYSDLCKEADAAELIGLSHEPDVALLWAGAWEVYDHEIDGTMYRVGTKRYATYLEARLQARIDKYKSGNIPTVLSKLACFAPNAVRLGHERLEKDRLDWFNDRVMAVAKANRTWVRVIDPYEPLCHPDGTSVRQTPTGIALREDGSHFDPPAAVWFWNTWLAGQMGAVFDGANTPGNVTTTVPQPTTPPPTTTAVGGPGG